MRVYDLTNLFLRSRIFKRFYELFYPVCPKDRTECSKPAQNSFDSDCKRVLKSGIDIVQKISCVYVNLLGYVLKQKSLYILRRIDRGRRVLPNVLNGFTKRLGGKNFYSFSCPGLNLSCNREIPILSASEKMSYFSPDTQGGSCCPFVYCTKFIPSYLKPHIGL